MINTSHNNIDQIINRYQRPPIPNGAQRQRHPLTYEFNHAGKAALNAWAINQWRADNYDLHSRFLRNGFQTLLGLPFRNAVSIFWSRSIVGRERFRLARKLTVNFDRANKNETINALCGSLTG